MKQLVLAEKPSVAKEIARVLGCHKKTKHYIEGPNYVVTWALGHLVTLAEPEDYDAKYKTWRLEDLPILPDRMNLKVMKETSHQFRAISQLAKRNDFSGLIIATDAGREGELVARWIMELIRWKKPYKRLWISSQTDQAIKDGFANLKPGAQFDNLYDSAVCRAEADWLIGLNMTRALTSKFNAQLAAGRVQTPTLSMMMQREEEIKGFVPVPYWTVEANFAGFSAVYRDAKHANGRIFNLAHAQSVVQKASHQTGKVTQLRTVEKTEPQPLAYDLTELQRDANRKHGFSAKQTSNVLQRLYEQHKLVTYPRTDSRHITSDMVPTLKGRLESVSIGPYNALIKPLLRKSLTITKRIVDDHKVTDHHAIIPTEQYVNLGNLSTEEKKLYDLIVRRFIALFYPICRYDETKVVIEAGGAAFHTSGKVMKNPGWKEVYGMEKDVQDEDEDQEDSISSGQLLPALKKGQELLVKRCEQQSHTTKPPARYTEANLLSLMEKNNLGTPATRADIIEKLLQTDTIERQGNRLVPTGKGKQLIEMVSSELKSAELTAKWERELESIAKGTGNMKSFLAEIRTQAKRMVKEVKFSSYQYEPHNLTHSKCPECSKNLMEFKGKRGKMLVCSDRECNYRRAAEPQLINKRCPQCRKKMELHTGKKGKYVQCRRCNVVELLNNQGGGKAERKNNKQLIQKYSDNSQLGNSLGDALKAAMQQKDTE